MLTKKRDEICDINNWLDGYITGRLVVDIPNNKVELERCNGRDKPTYVTLSEDDYIEVRNFEDYIHVTVREALTRMASGTEWPLFGGAYARVLKNGWKFT